MYQLLTFAFLLLGRIQCFLVFNGKCDAQNKKPFARVKDSLKLYDATSNFFGNLWSKLVPSSETAPIQKNILSKEFIFDEIVDSDYFHIVSAILSGLNILPSEKILKSGSQRGRRVQYSAYNRIVPTWKTVDAGHLSDFKSISTMCIQRVSESDDDNLGDALIEGSLRVYSFQLLPSDIEVINSKIASLLTDYKTNSDEGIAVSNAGGFHSTTDCFMDGSLNLLGELCTKAVNVAENHDFKSTSAILNNKMRTFQEYSQSEAWVNCNRHGHWNSLHTHSGSTWSGVYYPHTTDAFAGRSYSGNLLIKPSPHVTETKVLTEIEALRLKFKPTKYAQPERCDFVEITPSAGSIVLFPSYLQHAVMPLFIQDNYRSQVDRISVAFNFAEISQCN
jgi:hypothetical protein